MSAFANLVTIGLGNVPASISKMLQEIGANDKQTRILLNDLAKDENAFLEKLSAIAKHNPNFDEEPFKKMLHFLNLRRQLLVQMLEEQMKSSQLVYDYLDRKIRFFGA